MKIQNVLAKPVKRVFVNLSRHGSIVLNLHSFIRFQAETRASAGIVDEINPPPITRVSYELSYRTQA